MASQPTPHRKHRARPPLQAFELFFPAAAVYALAAVPLWTLEVLGLVPLLGGAGWTAWHGHEMVFGYALAVVAGYLLTKISPPALVAVFALWLFARIAFLALPLPPAAQALVGLSFPAALFAFTAPPFLRAAKTWRNAIFAVLLAGLVAAALAYEAGAAGALLRGEQRGIALGIDLLALLMFVMGGRVAAAATSGARRIALREERAVAQPRLEAAGVFAIFGLAAFEFWPQTAMLAAICAAAGAAVILLRLAGWRVWEVAHLPEVGLLYLGQGWLAVGLLLAAAANAFGFPPPADALHGITVGALGTLSLAMMTRTVLQRCGRLLAMPGAVTASAGLMTAAAVLRLLAALPELRAAMIALSALCWTLAFAAFLTFLLRTLAAHRAAGPAG